MEVVGQNLQGIISYLVLPKKLLEELQFGILHIFNMLSIHTKHKLFCQPYRIFILRASFRESLALTSQMHP